MSGKEEFLEIFRSNVHREGAEALLDYLENKSDFFTCPASAKFHGAYAGGLCDHSLNVYHCLKDYLARERVQELYGLEVPDESVAIAALLHDLCKIGCYKAGTRNVKNETTGQWEKVPTFFYEDPLPYGHGEKSVYIISGFMKLTRQEAMAIRWHMGAYDDAVKGGSRSMTEAMNLTPWVWRLQEADWGGRLWSSIPWPLPSAWPIWRPPTF